MITLIIFIHLNVYIFFTGNCFMASLGDCFSPVHLLGFPGSSGGKESACNTGNPGLIPGLGGSPGEGTGCPLQYPWASL